MSDHSNERATTALETYASHLPATTPDIAVLITGGRRRRRQRRLALGVGALALVAIGGGAIAQIAMPGPDSPAPVEAAQSTPVVEIFVPDLSSAATQPSEPCPDTSQLRGVEVPSPSPAASAKDALQALVSYRDESASQVYVSGFENQTNTVNEVRSVTYAAGLITVDLSLPLMDPFATAELVCLPDGAIVMAQIARTAQAALGTGGAILLTVNGAPAEGVWGMRLDGPWVLPIDD